MIPKKISDDYGVDYRPAQSEFDNYLLRREKNGDAILGRKDDGTLFQLKDLEKQRLTRRVQRAKKKFADNPEALAQVLAEIERGPTRIRAKGVGLKHKTREELSEYKRASSEKTRRKAGVKKNGKPGLKNMTREQRAEYRRNHRIKAADARP